MKNMSEITRGDVLQFVLRVTVVTAFSYFSMKWMMNLLDPTNKGKKKAKLQAEQQLKRLNLSLSQLNEYELVIASRLVVPEDINVGPNFLLSFVSGSQFLWLFLNLNCSILGQHHHIHLILLESGSKIQLHNSIA